MGISADGWFDWAERDPGPLNKLNLGINSVRGVVPHSAEGYWPHLGELLHSQERRASWFASNLKNGRFIQHYSIYAQTWTSGAGYPNNNFVAWENEGVAGQPFTPQQTANCIRVIRELMALKGWQGRRPINSADLTATLYEHNECTRWGAEATSCPSGRVPWDLIVPALKEEEDMAERVWNSDLKQTWIIGKNGSSPVLYPAMDEPFLALYGGHTKAMTNAQLEAIRTKN